MTSFVLGASITLSWYFEDEVSEAADHLLERLDSETAAVPVMWHLEVANVIAIAQRRGRVAPARSATFIAQLETLAIVVDEEATRRAFLNVLDLARAERLSAYDAAYLELAILELAILELAMRLGVPLATKDRALSEAANRLGVTVLGAD